MTPPLLLFSMDNAAAMIAGQVGQLVPMDEETSDQFRQLMTKKKSLICLGYI